jgi:hypothetical protein
MDAEGQRMKLDIESTFNRRLITPYSFKDRTYYLLFYNNGKKGPFYVVDSVVQPESLVHIGDVRQVETDTLVGNCFYSQSPTICEGSFLMAYSGAFRMSLKNRTPKDFEMDLVLKTPRFQVFNRKNKATLVVSPTLKDDIRENLEI